MNYKIDWENLTQAEANIIEKKLLLQSKQSRQL